MGMPKTRRCPYYRDSATLERCLQRLLGSLLSRRSAIGETFILFPATVPEVFAKVNSLQFPSRSVRWRMEDSSREVLQISIDGMIEWGQKSEPKNIHAEFPTPSLVVLYAENRKAMKLQIVLNTPSVPALINPPKKNSPNFSTKNLRVENFKPKKIPQSFSSLEIQSTHPQGTISHVSGKKFRKCPSQDNKKPCKVS